MTTGHELAAHWLVRSLGWTLLHFCWQGALIALVLWCALKLLAGRPAHDRYLAACLALGLMILLPLATLTQIGLHDYGLAAQMRSSTGDASLAVQAGLGDAATWRAGIASALEPYLPWVLVAWLVGLIVSLIRLSVGLRLAMRMKSLAVSPASVKLLQMFASLKERLGVLRPVGLMNSALVQVPTVVGWLRPVVLLPISCFTGLTEIQIEAILCHELAHIRRHDYLVSVLQSVVEAVLFYHPGVWWVSQQVRRERECCCDDLAVNVGGNALAYAKALSTLEARRGSYPEVVLGSNGGVLAMRIRRLLKGEEVSAGPQMAAVVVLILLTVAAGAIASTARAEGRPFSHAALQPAMVNSEPPAAAAPELPPVGSFAVAKVAAGTRSARLAVLATKDPAPDAQQAADPAQQTNQPTKQPTRVAGGVLAGQVLSKVAPVYPADAKAACVQGTVALRATIAKTGAVENLQVISGPRELYPSALDAVRQWIYKPYRLNGEPTEVETTISVNYSIDACAPQSNPPEAESLTLRKIGGAVSAPVLMDAPEAEFTVDAKAHKINGSVIVTFWVDEQGIPTHVGIVRGIGYGLDEEAVDVVKRYRFKPALENGTPVVVSMNVEIKFQQF